MKLRAPIPILRIFDEAKAREFYLDWLGFSIDFEHRFEPGTPLYMGISRDDWPFSTRPPERAPWRFHPRLGGPDLRR
jgi:hypothetical protein